MAYRGETIASGAAKTCPDCRQTPKLDVCRSGAGYYIGTYCHCGPYSRESGYFATQADAQAALDTGLFGRPVDEFANGSGQ